MCSARGTPSVYFFKYFFNTFPSLDTSTSFAYSLPPQSAPLLVSPARPQAAGRTTLPRDSAHMACAARGWLCWQADTGTGSENTTASMRTPGRARRDNPTYVQCAVPFSHLNRTHNLHQYVPLSDRCIDFAPQMMLSSRFVALPCPLLEVAPRSRIRIVDRGTGFIKSTKGPPLFVTCACA